MSQNNISFEGSMSGASMLDDRLTPLLNNIYSSNSGSTRPSYLQAGGTWFDSVNGKLMLFNGVSETALLAGSEGFADEDLSNLSETGQAIIDGKASVDLSNLDSTGNEVISHNAMPSDSYIDLTLEASGTEYTAQSDGVVSLAGTKDWVDIGIGATGRGSCSQGRSFDNFSRHDVQVKKGDKFTVFYGGSFAKNHFRFIYTEGAK